MDDIQLLDNDRTFPGPDVPMAFVSAAVDGSGFVSKEVITPVFTPDASQSDRIDANGITITAPNNDTDWDQALGVQ